MEEPEPRFQPRSRDLRASPAPRLRRSLFDPERDTQVIQPPAFPERKPHGRAKALRESGEFRPECPPDLADVDVFVRAGPDAFVGETTRAPGSAPAGRRRRLPGERRATVDTKSCTFSSVVAAALRRSPSSFLATDR